MQIKEKLELMRLKKGIKNRDIELLLNLHPKNHEIKKLLVDYMLHQSIAIQKDFFDGNQELRLEIYEGYHYYIELFSPQVTPIEEVGMVSERLWMYFEHMFFSENGKNEQKVFPYQEDLLKLGNILIELGDPKILLLLEPDMMCLEGNLNSKLKHKIENTILCTNDEAIVCNYVQTHKLTHDMYEQILIHHPNLDLDQIILQSENNDIIYHYVKNWDGSLSMWNYLLQHEEDETICFEMKSKIIEYNETIYRGLREQLQNGKITVKDLVNRIQSYQGPLMGIYDLISGNYSLLDCYQLLQDSGYGAMASEIFNYCQEHPVYNQQTKNFEALWQPYMESLQKRIGIKKK